MKKVALVVCLLCALAIQAWEKKQFDISEVRGTDSVYKIHGENDDGNGYECKSFSQALSDPAKKIDANAIIDYSKLASYSYRDDAGAYRDAAGQTVTRENALSGMDYQLLPKDDVANLIRGSGLSVDGNGNIYNESSLHNGLSAVILFKGEIKRDSNGKIVGCGEIVIAYRGTSSGRDVFDDATQVALPKVVPQQYKDSAELLHSVMANTSSDVPIVCTGHSMGGGEVTYAMAATNLGDRNVKGYTYNAAGLSESTVESLRVDGVTDMAGHLKEVAKNITNVRNEKDPVSYVGYHIGEMYEVTESATYLDNAHNLKNDHSLQHLTENMETVRDIAYGGISSDKPLTDQTSSNSQSTSDSGLSFVGPQQSDNILQTMFSILPSETSDSMQMATSVAGAQIEKIVNGATQGVDGADVSLGQKVKDFITGKIDEAIKNGKEWLENGGIRNTLKEQIGKMLDGKVTDADKQRILNMTDGLCNVSKDGGKSLVASLGNDGLPLATSLALNELKKQIASVLPAEDAAHLNAMIDTMAGDGSTAEKRAQILSEVQKLVSEKIPYENSARAINDILHTIADGKAVNVLDSVKNIGNAVGIDALKDVISKNLDPETSAKLNALLDGYAANGIQGLDDELMAQINAMIDKAAPGADSAEKLKKVYQGLKDGTITVQDVKDAATATVADGAKSLIDKSDLPDAVKNAAKAAIDGLAEDGLNGLTKNMEEYIHSQVEAALGTDAADAVVNIIDAVVTPGQDPWDVILKNADKIGEAIKEKLLNVVEDLAESQLNKLIDKFPGLKAVLDKLGIDAKGIIQGLKNVLGVLKNAPDLTTAISQLSEMAISFLKDIAAKLIDWALEWAMSWVNDWLIPKAIDWASGTLGKWASSSGNPRIKAGLEWLQKQVQSCKKCARIKIKTEGTGAKVMSKIDAMIEKTKKPGETVVEGSTKK